MKRVLSLLVFVVAVLAIQQTSLAQAGAQLPSGTPLPPVVPPNATGFLPSQNSVAKFAAKRTGEASMSPDAFNGYALLRSQPDPGAVGSAGHGFHHFSLQMDRYTNWYRPKAATLTQCQRCAPDSFRPRGFGNLFARPADGYRMEFEPYALSDSLSNYGPAYIVRMPDPRCPDCDHSAKHAGDCRQCP